MAWQEIADTEIDAGSPVTETLLDKYRDRDDYVRNAVETLTWIRHSVDA